MVDYRSFRLNKINSPEFKHIKLIIFWPVYCLFFWALEFWTNRNFFFIHVPLDDKIPFCEYFIIPYHFWFIFMIGMLIYTFFTDVPNFKKYMWFIIITYSIACLTYLVFPNAQGLRPQAIGDDNIFSAAVKALYKFDTNTNVCPSLHVIGSVAVCNAGLHMKRLSHPAIRTVIVILTVLISISTVFLKQHSIVDIFAGIIVCVIVYPFIYSKKSRFFGKN